MGIYSKTKEDTKTVETEQVCQLAEGQYGGGSAGLVTNLLKEKVWRTEHHL